VIDADLATVTAASDKVVRVLDAPPWLLHLELQAAHETNLARRLHWYNTLLHYRHEQRVRTLLVLLRPAADSPQLSGLHQEAFPAEAPYLEFRYQVLRIWQVPVEQLLGGGLGTSPLAPLSQVTELELPGVVREMGQRLQDEANPQHARTLWSSAIILSGLRLSPSAIACLFQGVGFMQDILRHSSVTELAKILGAREMLLRLGRRLFGPPAPEITTALEKVFELERLERMAEAIPDVKTWEELLAIP
jgi:hypothetical protein